MKTTSNIKHCESTYCSNFFTVGHKRRQKFCQRSCGKRMANDRWATSNPEKVNASQRNYKRNDGHAARFTSWAFPGSLAVTRGILVSFFSSA